MKIKSIKRIKTDKPVSYYDITVDSYSNFSIGDSGIVVHNSSLISAINKLARPFGNALQILDGDGFFGTEVSPSPAAPRYTGVRLSPIVNGILNKYNHLTTKDPEGPYDPLWMDIPLGLISPIVGIAVGYKSIILPRKLKDIQDFLNGKRKSVKPYFEGFLGIIEKYNNAENAWIISSKVEVENKKIMIREIPPIVKYESILKRLDHLINAYESNIKIIDNSNIKVNIDIIYTGKSESEFENIIKFVKKLFSVIVTENLVFVKDGAVLIYNSIEQYLEDYKWQIVRLKLKNTLYERDKLSMELKFNYAKDLFISYVLQKTRTIEELNDWLKTYEKEIAIKLENMTSKKFTKDELAQTKERIKQLIIDLKQKEIELNESQAQYDKFPDPTLLRGAVNKANVVNLFDTDDISENKDGIAIWNGQDVYDVNGNFIDDDNE